MIDPTMVPVFTGLTFEQLGQTVLILIAKCDALQARLDAMAALTDDQRNATLVSAMYNTAGRGHFVFAQAVIDLTEEAHGIKALETS